MSLAEAPDVPAKAEGKKKKKAKTAKLTLISPELEEANRAPATPEEQAAIKIQANFRGHLCLKQKQDSGPMMVNTVTDGAADEEETTADLTKDRRKRQTGELRALQGQLAQLLAGQGSIQQELAQVKAMVERSRHPDAEGSASGGKEKKFQQNSLVNVPTAVGLDIKAQLTSLAATQEAKLNSLAANQADAWNDVKKAISRLALHEHSAPRGHGSLAEHEPHEHVAHHRPHERDSHHHPHHHDHQAEPVEIVHTPVAYPWVYEDSHHHLEYRGPYQAPGHRESELETDNVRSSTASSVNHARSHKKTQVRESLRWRARAEHIQKELAREQLMRVFSTAEVDKQLEVEHHKKTYWQRFTEAEPAEKANYVDLFMGAVICINMMVIGLSMDAEANVYWLALDVTLSVIFILEIIIKVKLFGVMGHFVPSGTTAKMGSVMDTSIVIIDIAQMCVQLADIMGDGGGGSEMRSSLLRMLRLARLTRIIRVMRLEMFRDLILMVSGLAVGMPTLIWAIILFAITIYVVSMFARMAFGAGGPYDIKVEFETMQDALFAVFRCSFGDCTTKKGTSLLGLVIDFYGWFAGGLSSLFIFFVTIGLFNVISAIFVEATLSARSSASAERQKQKLNDFSLFAKNMKILIEGVVQKGRVSEDAHEFNYPEQLYFDKDHFDDWGHIEVSTDAFRKACIEDEDVKHALRELDIHEGDFPVLSDILDPQNDHKLCLKDILEGITRLRGEPRRSDIVNVDLTIRDIQQTVRKLRKSMNDMVDHFSLDPGMSTGMSFLQD